VRHPLFRFYRAGQTQYLKTLASIPAIQKASLVFHEERDLALPFSWPIQGPIESISLLFVDITEGIVDYLLRPPSDQRIEALQVTGARIDFFINGASALRAFPRGLFRWPNL
jgi:hypothetical protein